MHGIIVDEETRRAEPAGSTKQILSGRFLPLPLRSELLVFTVILPDIGHLHQSVIHVLCRQDNNRQMTYEVMPAARCSLV